jgi:pSer/pThr/pTyr-binding forkhead associated (FHA) protein
LIVISGEAQASEFPLSLPAIVGRSRAADVKLGHALVSRKHCELFEADGQLVVRDLGSLNGTFVGDTRITDATLLPPGAKVTIGAITFQAVYGDMSEQPTSTDAGEATDTLASAASATAAPIEQTLEMSDFDSPLTEPTEGASDAGMDFGWLENSDEPQSPAGPSSASIEPDEPAQPLTEELNLLHPAHGAINGAADEACESDRPEPQQTEGGNDDLDDFFASLK